MRLTVLPDHQLGVWTSLYAAVEYVRIRSPTGILQSTYNILQDIRFNLTPAPEG